jgi:hypothetical protein
VSGSNLSWIETVWMHMLAAGATDAKNGRHFERCDVQQTTESGSKCLLNDSIIMYLICVTEGASKLSSG